MTARNAVKRDCRSLAVSGLLAIKLERPSRSSYSWNRAAPMSGFTLPSRQARRTFRFSPAGLRIAAIKILVSTTIRVGTKFGSTCAVSNQLVFSEKRAAIEAVQYYPWFTIFPFSTRTRARLRMWKGEQYAEPGARRSGNGLEQDAPATFLLPSSSGGSLASMISGRPDSAAPWVC